MPAAIPAAIAGGGALLGGILNNKAAKEAAAQQAQSSAEAIKAQQAMLDRQLAWQKEQYAMQAANQAPWLAAGTQSLGDILQGLQQGGEFRQTWNPQDVTQDPGYQFRLNEGMKSIQRAQSAAGRGASGAAAKAMQRYAQDYASGEGMNSFNRFQQQQGNLFNRLASMAGIGQQAVGQLGNAGSNMANQMGAYGGQAAGNISNLLTGMGNAQAAGTIGAANAWNSALGQGLNAWQQNNMMNQMMNMYGGGGGMPSAYAPGFEQMSPLGSMPNYGDQSWLTQGPSGGTPDYSFMS